MARLLLLFALVSGCASVQPTAPVGPGRIDPPVQAGVLLGPDALTGFVRPDADGVQMSRMWSTWMRSDGLRITARVEPISSEAWSFDLVSGALDPETGEPGPSVSGWPSRVASNRTTVRLGPDREVVALGDAAAAFARVDLAGLAAAVPRDTAFVHPRTQAVRFGRQAAARYARAARLVAGSAVFPDQLATLLPDTTGLGITPGAQLRAEWERADPVWVWDGWLPDDLHRAEESSVASIWVQDQHGGRAGIALADVPPDVSGVADRAFADSVETRPTSPAEGPYHWMPMRSGLLGAVVRIEERWILGRGTDTTLVSALLRRVDAAALSALVPRLAWRPAQPAEVGGPIAGLSGLVEEGDRVRVSQLAPDEGHAGERLPPLTFQIPPGWLVTSTIGIWCNGSSEDWGWTVALFSRAPVDPCRTGPEAERYGGVLDHYAQAGPAVEIRRLVPMADTFTPWLVTWPGYAPSLLEPWTSSFETTRAPALGADGLVTLALTGPDLVVDVTFVPLGPWLVGVVGAGRPGEAEQLRAAVASVASSLLPSP